MDIERIIGAFGKLDPYIETFLDRATVDRWHGSPKFDGWDAPFLDPAVLNGAERPCILAVIDDSIPLLHPLLTRQVGEGPRSRIAAAWIMGAPRTARFGRTLQIGREVRGTQIDRWLAERGPAGLDEEAVLRREGLWDASRGPRHAGGRAHAHGAAVAGLLAGYAPDDPAGGARPVIAVALPPEITRDTEGTFAPWFLHAALVFVMRRAAALAPMLRHLGPPSAGPPPLVVNLSYGVSAGSKDGFGAVPTLLRAFETGEGLPPMLRADRDALGPVRFVLPMGNHRRDRLRARLAPGSPEGAPAEDAPAESVVHWVLPPADATPSFLEIWGPSGTPPAPVRIAITPPGGSEIVVPDPGASWIKALTLGGPRLVIRAYKSIRPASWTPDVDGRAREVLTIALPPTEPHAPPLEDGMGRPGAWRVRSLSDVPLDLHVQRDDAIAGYGGGRQSSLVDGRYEPKGPDGRYPFEGPDGQPEPRPSRFGVTEEGTVNAYAAGEAMLGAGALRGDGAPAFYSALGGKGISPERRPLRGDASAVADRSGNLPGVPVIGALAGARGRASGTSMAAPQVARALADHLASRED